MILSVQVVMAGVYLSKARGLLNQKRGCIASSKFIKLLEPVEIIFILLEEQETNSTAVWLWFGVSHELRVFGVPG